MGKHQKKNLLLFLLAGLLAVSCTACGKETKTENSKAEISVSEQSTAVSGAEESMEEVQPVKLNHTYTTKFSDANAVTYPHFLFDYSDNWTISQEEVTTNTESVTLANDHGAEIKFRYFGYPKDFNFGTSNATMTRVEVSKIGDSQFVPSYVQGTDHSDLGKFMVAQLKVTGELDMQTDSDFSDIDGAVSYAVLPESWTGTDVNVRGPFEGEFSFWYSGYLSFTCNMPEGEISASEKQEILAILSSFRNES